jgi:hypothetical protein
VNPVKPNPYVNTRPDPQPYDSFVQQPIFSSSYQGQGYPGVNPFDSYNPSVASTALSTPSSSLGSSFNINQIKGIIDRMGGIDGLMGHVGRIQKFIQSIQQMSPMLKVLMGSFGSKATTTAKGSGDGLASPNRRRRKISTRKSSKKNYKRRSR